jgi:hypothetical protein
MRIFLIAQGLIDKASHVHKGKISSKEKLFASRLSASEFARVLQVDVNEAPPFSWFGTSFECCM